MKWKSEPRPLSIRVFSAAFLAAALVRLLQGLNDLSGARAWLSYYQPELAQSDDVLIVMLSAEFTIALIPVIWIYGFAASFARWLVLGFGAAKLLAFGIPFAVWMTSGGAGFAPPVTAPALTVIALIALLTPSADRWLNPEEAINAAVFE